MDVVNKAARINLFSLRSVQMRTFHLTWFAFFLCFFGWFGIAPLMPVVKGDLGLTKQQIGNTIIASVAITVLVRILIGYLCDRVGPRRVYTVLLALGSLPVMLIGLADSYQTFLLARLAIGAIGASFVITQYHTSIMFDANVVGTANATTAGWGNLGGGVTQMVMPLVFTAIVTMGADHALGWRLAMVVPGIAMLLTAFAYWKWTTDAPDGDFKDLRARGILPAPGAEGGHTLASFIKAAERLPGVGAVSGLRRLLRRGADHQQCGRHVLLQPLSSGSGDGGPDRRAVRADEYLRPHPGRRVFGPLRAQPGPEGSGAFPVRRRC